MVKSEIRNPKQIPNFQTKKFWLLGIGSLVIIWLSVLGNWNFSFIFAQESELEFTLDVNAQTIPLPNIFKPNIDLSGRGFHRDASWPQGLASPEALDSWQKDIGFSGIYRLQYNLWEINQFIKDKKLQEALLFNYENIIKKINDAGGIVLLDIFGMPKGYGRVLDRKSPPFDLRVFKSLIKSHIRNLSCEKKFNIWYEVWSAPDLDDFFLGRKQDYLNMYRAAAESIKELEAETKIHIPLGGPSSSWWFQNVDGNTIVTPEESLIYELIKFCYQYRLPLDFITWHGFSTDPKVEKEITRYNKTTIALIRDWFSYFKFDRNIPLIIDEWNYDRGTNVLSERKENSNICASYILARLKNMYGAGLDYQLYFSLEDFHNSKEGVVRNTGIFWFDPEFSEYKGGPKSIYNVFKMLTGVGQEMFLANPKPEDEFVGIIATKGNNQINILIYNYIDPDIATNFLSRNIGSLKAAERKTLLNIIKSQKLEKILRGQLDVGVLRLSNKVKTLLNKAKELNDKAMKFKSSPRNIKIAIKNLSGDYLYQRYVVDSSCSMDCKFAPVEEKEVSESSANQEILSLNPYVVNMIILKPKPAVPEISMPAEAPETKKE